MFGIDSYTKLMLHCNGADGSTTFTDDSASGHTVTAHGNFQVDTAQYKFGTASGLSDGNGDYLQIPDSDDWYLGTGDFTLDWWIKFNNSTSPNPQRFFTQGSGSNLLEIYMYNNKITFTFTSGGSTIVNFVMNSGYSWGSSWHHIAIIRYGTNSYICIDGVAQSISNNTAFGTTSLPNLAADLGFGYIIGGTNYPVNGWVDELRWSKGIARWTSFPFTPPTSAYTALASAPQNLIASMSGNDVALSWEAPVSDGGSTITGYKIERESPTGNGFSVLVADTGNTNLTYTDTTTELDIQYNYRVSAINEGGSGILSNSAEITTYMAGMESIQLSPALEWAALDTKTLNPVLEWFSSKIAQKNTALEWYGLGQKFVPNLLHYPLYFAIPSILTSKVILGWSGCFPGYSISMQNTGSSGNTVIEIYVKSELISTITIPADNLEYTKLEHVLMDFILSPTDEFEIKITSVASDAQDLKIGLYEMTFPFSMEVLECGNLNEDNVEFWGLERNWFFTGATSWYVEANQPILEVISAVALSVDSTETDITASITNGKFYSNRLVISSVINPDTVKLRFYVKDLSGAVHTLEQIISIQSEYADFPEYATNALVSATYGDNLCVGGIASDLITRTPSWSSNLFSSLTTTASNQNPTRPPNYATDDLQDLNYWGTPAGLGMPQWIQVDFGLGNETALQRYAVQPRGYRLQGAGWYIGDPNGFPESWLFQGSQDGINWTTLDTQTDVNYPYDTSHDFPYTYDISNVVAYRYYRLYITKSRTNSYVELYVFHGHTDSAQQVVYNCIDADINTAWSDPIETTVPQYWMYDFGVGNEKQVQQLQMMAGNDANGLHIKDFILAGSNVENPDMDSNTDWTYVYGNRMASDSELYDQYQVFTFKNTVAYRYYRLMIGSTYNTDGKVSLKELKLQEKINSVNAMRVFSTYLPFESYQYSFDGGITWIQGQILGTKFTTGIDFTDKVAGTYTINFKYIVNGLIFEATKNIIYDPDDLSVFVQFFGGYFTVAYQDDIPLDKVELYKDDVLLNTYVPITGNGFETATLNTTDKTWTISEGKFYYQGEIYTHSGLPLDIEYALAGESKVRVAFGFNTATKEFEIKLYKPVQYGTSGVESFTDFITIWIQDIVISISSDLSSWAIVGIDSQWYVFNPDKIGFSTTEDATYQVLVYDLAGRVQTFTLEFKVLSANTWYILTVRDSNGDIVIPGQITQDSTLTYSVEKNDN